MAYVPGYKHDCFLSYDHRDSVWVSAFQKRLTDCLLDRLGQCSIWQDEKKLRTGQNIGTELDKAIRASTAFIAVLSRNYHDSDWCERELDIFLKETAKADLETGGYGRTLKVIRLPWLNDDHLGFYSEYKHFEFFDRDQGYERSYKPNSRKFLNAVDKLSVHIADLFEAITRGMQKVFIARAAGTATEEERGTIIRRIKDAGFALSPSPSGKIWEGLDRETLRRYIDASFATVHVLGADTDPAVRQQIDLALGAGKQLIFYLAPGYEFASGEQKDLIHQIRENHWRLNPGTWDLLDSRVEYARLNDLLGVLARQRTVTAKGISPGSGRESAKRVYLLCDPTTTEDANFARHVRSKIIDKEDNIQVDLPPPPAESESSADHHDRLLRSCDGLLLYHEKAPPKWVDRNFRDLLTAKELPDRRELKSRALLICGGDIAYPGITIIQRRDPFDIQQLEPFLAQLRETKSKQGAAHGSG